MGTEAVEPGLHHFGGDKALGLCVSWNNGAGKLGARCSMGFEHRRWMEPVDATIIGRPGEETSRDSLWQVQAGATGSRWCGWVLVRTVQKQRKMGQYL